MEYPYSCVRNVLRYTHENIKSTKTEGVTNVTELFRKYVHLLMVVVDNNKVIIINADVH